ncbi:Ig-like domain-containing protein [Lacticaseibacillus nasuensis]|uniref:Ig-like domain-containing protein n=1 Tax=Lacticaseibacillus nasuensis TaxID=944671 RepID=UPI002246EE32|nr:Ig-like domain-containing protein [Lacticaseibacillus nasuensis]
MVTPAAVSVTVGATTKLTATVAPADADDATGKWSIGSDSIATIADDGTVTGVAEGTATATYTTTDGAKTATATITVTAAA